jgi:excisionase family DNA binding protein
VAGTGTASLDPTARLIPLAEQAAILGVHHLTLRGMVRRGEVPYFRVGSQYRFDPAAVRAALAG